MTLSLTAIVSRRSRNRHGFYDYLLEVVSHNFVDDNLGFAEKIKNSRVFAEFLSPESAADLLLDIRHGEHDRSIRNVYSPKNGGTIIELQNNLYVTFMAGSENYELCRAHLDEALKVEHLYVAFNVDLRFSLFEENEHLERPVTRQQFLTGVKQFCSNLETPDLVCRSVP